MYLQNNDMMGNCQQPLNRMKPYPRVTVSGDKRLFLPSCPLSNGFGIAALIVINQHLPRNRIFETKCLSKTGYLSSTAVPCLVFFFTFILDTRLSALVELKFFL